MSVSKSLLLPLPYHPFPTDDPVVMVDNKISWTWNRLEGGLICCWGDSVNVAGGHSKLLLLSPERSGSDVHDCQSRALAKPRQDTTRHTKAEIFLFL